MKAIEIFEQGTIGSSPYPTAGGSTIVPTSVSGNVQQLQDPKMAAAMLAKQNQDKQNARNQIMKQIQDLQRQITALRSQQASIR